MENMENTEQSKSIFSTETLIPIGLVIIVIGGVGWLTTMFNDITYLKRDLVDIKTNLTQQIGEIKIDLKEVKQLIIDQK
jgi:hypothetical protein